MALVLGTCGNIIILTVAMTTRAMNKVGRDFIVNLAVADLCVALVADPMCILGNPTHLTHHRNNIYFSMH